MEFNLNPGTMSGGDDPRVSVNPKYVSSVFSTAYGTCIVVGGKAHDVVERYDIVMGVLRGDTE